MKKILILACVLFQYALYAQKLPDSYTDGKYYNG